jgi:hypothetical protein
MSLAHDGAACLQPNEGTSSMREFFALFSRSTISLIGGALTTMSAVAFLSLFAVHLAGAASGAYTGILAFLIIPAFFVLGLILIPVGVWRARRRRRTSGETEAPQALVVDFNQPGTRKLAAIILPLTLVNLIVVATATYKGVEVMDSNEFCGTACHSVMSPEYETYQRSPHSRVKCTECHIGRGADWFVKSKLSGAWQLVSVSLDLYPKPIPTPVHNLRPARETCEECHWPEKFVGERLRVRSKFADDETTTETKNVYLLNVGGVTDGQGKGIHWHVDPNIQIRYRADARRQNIYEVEFKQADGTLKLYRHTDGVGEDMEPSWRTMDCIDCHNRPTHIYQYPEEEIDLALGRGELDRSLPYIKREGLRIIQAEYASHEEARVGIKNALRSYYQQEYPELAKDEAQKIDTAGEALYGMYRRNVFPQMRIEWGTYPNFAYEHVGCFRCHDKKHATEEGERISARCSTCHAILATEEEDPEILEILHP